MKKNTPPRPKLILGLGNPSQEYTLTYHNLGRLTVESLIEKNRPRQTKKVTSKKYEIIKLKDQYLGYSLVFMNDSGKAVIEASKKFGIAPEDILVIHDDSDIGIGQYKLTFGQGAAGHKGILSIINSLGTKNFWRLRLGIRPNQKNPLSKRPRAKSFVLKKITPHHQETFMKLIDEINAKILN